MNSLSGAESTTMLNTGWGWNAGRCGGKKADYQGFAVRQDQPHYSTPSPTEWSFTHLQGLKKAPSILSLSIRNIRMMLRSISTNPAIRDLTPSTPSEVGHNAAEDEEGMGTVFGFFPASCFCLFSACLSSMCWRGLSHHSCHFLHFSNTHSLGTPICPAPSFEAQYISFIAF